MVASLQKLAPINTAENPPPLLLQDTASDPTPPTAQLPAPQENQSRIAEICKKYNIREISGSGATSSELDTLERVFAQMPKGFYSNLAFDYEPSHADPAQTSRPGEMAYWNNAMWNGEKLRPGALATESRGSRIYLFRPGNAEWTICHETCHHISLMVDQRFGNQLAKELGYSRKDKDETKDFELGAQTWSADQPDPTTFPTEYAKAVMTEHLADLMSAWIIGTGAEVHPVNPILPEFKGPGAGRKTMSDRLGPGKI
jgi:hypothetical protein